jgi:hypothetical protein
MKGYSFQELVKLAEAAVRRAGDTMTGNLTAPKVLVSDAQGTESNALTRKDYVDGEIAKQVAKTGGTMTGALTVPSNRGLTSARGSGGQSVAVSSEGTWVMMWRENNQSGVKADEFIGIDSGSNLRFRKDQGLGNGLYTDHLVYHQGYKPTPGDVGAVNKTGDTMTGNLTVPKVLLSATQGTEVSALTRKDYVDGEIAKQVAKTGDTMTGALTSVQATGNWRIAPTTTGNYGSFWHQDTNNLYLMLTNINNQTGAYNSLRPFVVSLSSGLVDIGNGLILTATQGTDGRSATRKDYVDSAIAAGEAVPAATNPLISNAQLEIIDKLSKAGLIGGANSAKD